jgi:hypothetical protein
MSPIFNPLQIILFVLNGRKKAARRDAAGGLG